MEKKRRETRISATFKIGAVSLVFLIIGYQTAVFVHRSAILRIEAGRDRPDTVYIVERVAEGFASDSGSGFAGGSSGPGSRSGGSSGRSFDKGSRSAGFSGGSALRRDTIRRNAPHSAPVRAVREATRRVESFRFNPNEVSVEDLMRLGFSEKQAQSIDSYRQKGGRFRRKSDFARSFVVSDSVFRRLEPYIDIPLTDINRADSAAFDALPGIGLYFAAKMVEYRGRLGGYSYPEQLMDIYHFDEEKFAGLKDLISCSAPEPYRLWQLPADSLRLHPYIGGWKQAKAIVLLRQHTPADSLSVEAIRKAGILSEEACDKLSRCAIAAPGP